MKLRGLDCGTQPLEKPLYQALPWLRGETSFYGLPGFGLQATFVFYLRLGGIGQF